MRSNAMDGLPREKTNMAKNLKDMIICEYVQPGCVDCFLKFYKAQLQATHGPVNRRKDHHRT
jgi:hypothetical protein